MKPVQSNSDQDLTVKAASIETPSNTSTSSKRKKIKRKAIKPTNQEKEERISEVITVLSKSPNIHKTQIRRIFCPRWNVHWVTVDRYVLHARHQMMVRLRRSREDFICESLAFYESILNDATATAGEKIRARQRIDELLGLDEPRMTYGRLQVIHPKEEPKIINERVVDLSKLSTEKLEILDQIYTEAIEAEETKQNNEPKGTP